MAQASRSKASLRLIGDSLNPKEISALLGCEGTTMYSKGDVRVNKRTGKQYERKSGHWSLVATECEPEDIDGQVSEILSQLPSDLILWNELASKYSIDLFCGIFMEKSNEGMDISSKTLVELGSRGIMLALDIYDGAE
ncbi:DUF4279 domain-containing protein [Zooshikella harenae]|uniref:DUF4279 domain-containing protein n=1 Tax=Zooshikella harenae TaxID=2827238 RepID=A0ABS5ZLN5_9GAMM|nr:DUF4279 domain-containing protein [Zooshikella harenae]MBU2714376.1 DUF4279 domain-containing protein [Zooshikella harenae]